MFAILEPGEERAGYACCGPGGCCWGSLRLRPGPARGALSRPPRKVKIGGSANS